MNKCVSIFGGIGTKQSHYKHAIEVYKSNGYDVSFYENKFINFCIPHKYRKIVNLAYTNDKTGTIIHSNSGGFWAGLEYLSKTNNNKLFICEAGPLKCDTAGLIAGFENLRGVKCPSLISNNITTICHTLGIPTEENHDWYNKYNADLKLIKHFVCLTSKNDIVINSNFINEMIVKINDDKRYAVRYDFNSGTHWNISKSDTQKYQDILQKHLNQISK